MFLIIATLLLGGGLALAYYMWESSQRPATLPPGPTYLPWLAYSLVTTETSTTAQLESWRKMHGSVFTVCFKKEYGVVACDYTSVGEILARPDVRPALPYEIPTLSNTRTGEEKTISPEQWQQVCRLCKDYLSENWATRRTSKIQDEAAYISDYLHSVDQSPTDIKQLFPPSVANILCALLYGQCYDQDDKELLELLQSGEILFTYMLETVFLEILGFETSTGGSNVSAAFADLTSFNQRMIAMRRARLDEDGYDDPRDFLEFCLCQDPESDSEEDMEASDHILCLVLNYFIYNMSQTVAKMLMDVTEQLAKHPDVQTRIHGELEQVVGLMPVQFDVTDSQRLPYMRAVITEALRLSGVTATLHPHLLTEGGQHGEYTLPKDTTVYLKLYSSHRDEDIWKDANMFKPDRFLTEDGDFVQNVEQYKLFSQGVYPVEGLAEDIVFVLVASLLQSFSVSPPAEANGSAHLPPDSPETAPTKASMISTHQLVFTPRF